MSKDKQLQKVSEYSVDNISAKSDFATRGLRDLEIIALEDGELCKYCKKLVEIFDSDGICLSCIILGPEPRKPLPPPLKFVSNHDYLLVVKDALSRGRYDLAHEVLDLVINTDSELANVAFRRQKYPIKLFKKKEIEDDRFEAMFFKAKLFEDQSLRDNALRQYQKILEISPDNNYVKDKISALKSLL